MKHYSDKKILLNGIFSKLFLSINRLFILQLLIAFPVTAQQLNNEQQLWKQESFGSFNMESEDISKRSQYSKHFKNENGKMTAVVTAGPMHYFENGNWKTIYHTINANSTGFENTANRHKTYYPKTASGKIVTVLENGNQMTDMIEMRMYYQSNGKELNAKFIQNQQGQVSFNELLYPNAYGNGIDLKLRHNTTGRKMDYVIRDRSALGIIPSNADYLVFEEKVELPAGWKAILNDKTIQLKDGTGTIVAFYDQPYYTDTDTHTHHEHQANEPHEHNINEIIGDYQIEQRGNLLTIKTLVPVNWLKQDLNFPVFIDPTVTLYPDNAARWTGHHRTYSNSSSDCYTSGCNAYTNNDINESVQGTFWLGRLDTRNVYHGWVKFNITDIPDDACITSAVFRYNVQQNNSNSSGCVIQSRFRHMATDPSTNAFDGNGTGGNPNNQARLTDIRDGDIYSDVNTAVLVSGTGWRTVNLTANLVHLQTQLVPNWFAIGIQTYHGASNHLTCRNQIMGYTESNRPQLIVDYDPPTDVENITICPEDLPYNWYGQTINSGGNGVATRITQGANGCDLEVTLNLTVNPGTPPQTDNQTICSNELPGVWNGQIITTGGNGVATHTSQDINGCDYVTTLNLTVIPVANSTETITICQNELPYTWNGQTVNTGGSSAAIHTIDNGNGCNDTITLNLIVNNEVNLTDDITICESELPYTWNGQTINAGGNGVATHTVQDPSGCDVTTILNLTVSSITNLTDDITICENELPYTWNGQTMNTGGNGIATHITQDANGCDVTTTLNLTVNPVTNLTDNISICQNELPYTWNGQTINAGGNGVATYVTQDANGCDVTTTLNLTVNPITNLTDNITICDTELPYTWNGQTINTGGNGVATHITQDANGCDVITTLNLTIFSSSNLSFIAQANNCTPAAVNIVPTISIQGGNCTWTINGATVNGDCSGVNTVISQAGCYDVGLVVVDANGCTASTSQNNVFCIEESPVADFEFNNQTLTSVGTINLSSNADSYLWVLPDGSTTSEFSPTVPLGNNPGIYTVTLYAYSSSGNCSDSISLSLEVIHDLTIPNVITVNGDGINDHFILDGLLPNTKLLILNRWGNLIYTSDNYDNTWNGRDMRGNIVSEGVYTYVVTPPDGIKRHGFVHVVH